MICGPEVQAPRIQAMAKLRGTAIASELSGAVGPVIFLNTPQGVRVRGRGLGRDPGTPAQRAARDRLSAVGRAWVALSLEDADAWRDYALRIGLAPSQAQQVFSRLAARFLMASPGGAIPTGPPGAPFLGDSVLLGVAAAPSGVLVTASRANGPGVVTELQLQPLESIHRRTYLERYRTAWVGRFEGAGPVVLPAAPGVWAVAARFILSATGEATGLAELGRVRVG